MREWSSWGKAWELKLGMRVKIRITRCGGIDSDCSAHASVRGLGNVGMWYNHWKFRWCGTWEPASLPTQFTSPLVTSFLTSNARWIPFLSVLSYAEGGLQLEIKAWASKNIRLGMSRARSCKMVLNLKISLFNHLVFLVIVMEEKTKLVPLYLLQHLTNLGQTMSAKCSAVLP